MGNGALNVLWDVHWNFHSPLHLIVAGRSICSHALIFINLKNEYVSIQNFKFYFVCAKQAYLFVVSDRRAELSVQVWWPQGLSPFCNLQKLLTVLILSSVVCKVNWRSTGGSETKVWSIMFTWCFCSRRRVLNRTTFHSKCFPLEHLISECFAGLSVLIFCRWWRNNFSYWGSCEQMLNSQQITISWIFAVFLRGRETAETTHYFIGEKSRNISTVAAYSPLPAESYAVKYIHSAIHKTTTKMHQPSNSSLAFSSEVAALILLM